MLTVSEFRQVFSAITAFDGHIINGNLFIPAQTVLIFLGTFCEEHPILKFEGMNYSLSWSEDAKQAKKV